MAQLKDTLITGDLRVTGTIYGYATKDDMSELVAATDAMVFKGTIGPSGSTISELPASHTVGDTYRVNSASTVSYAGQGCENGDLIICVTSSTSANNAHWVVAQTNIDGAVTGPTSATTDRIATFNGTSGRVIKDSGYTTASFAASDHTHSANISATGSNPTSLSANTTYTLTAGGNAIVFKTPADTTYSVTTTGNGNAVTEVTLSGTTITATKGATFAASGHTHSKSEITDFSHAHGNVQSGGTLQTTDVTIATGDKLVITDSTDGNKVARASLTFNTSSTTSFLRNDGKWATPVDNDTITTWYGTSSTAATTTAKTSSITNFALKTGAIATISFSTANTITGAAITLNINSTGAKTIYLDSGATSSTNQLTWEANTVMTFMYNGTGYVLISTSKPVVAQIVRW